MNKKFYTVFLAVILTTSYAQAQPTFGVRTGFSLTCFGGNNINYENAKMKPGFQIGVVGEFGFSESFVIQPGILFATQGAKADFSYISYIGGSWIGEKTLNLNYLQVPINALYKIDLGDMKLFVQAGTYFGIAISGKVKEKLTGGGGTFKNDIVFGSGYGEMKRMDLGIGLGTGLQFGNIQAGFSYNLGLINLMNLSAHPDFSMTNNGMALTVTYMFGKKE